MIVDAGKFGMPWHGKIFFDVDGLYIHLPNGEKRAWSYSISTSNTPIKLRAPDAQAAPETTADEAALGQEWRNYSLYQYGKDDIYHTTRIGTNYAGQPVVGAWWYMPAFGLTYEIVVTGPSSGSYKVYAIARASGEATLIETINYSSRTVRLMDVADGAGGRALIGLVPVGQSGNPVTVMEWTLSYDAETGTITLSDTELLADATSGNTSSRNISYVPRKYGRIDSEVIDTPMCGGLPRTLTHFFAVVDTVTPGQPDEHEYYETWSSGSSSWVKKKYENETGSTVGSALLAALYIDGVASTVVLKSTSAYTKTWSFSLTYDYDAHTELNDDCSTSLVVDTPRAFSDVMTYAYNKTTTTEIIINGVSVITRTSTASVAASNTRNGDIPNTIWHDRWDYTGTLLLGHADGDFTVDGTVTQNTWYPTGSVAAPNGLNLAIPKKLHPIIYESWSGKAIHPGGIEIFAFDPGTQKINYNPTTGAVEADSANFSYV